MQMQHPSLALVALLGVGCLRVDPLPGLDGVRGSEGALLWADGPLPEGAVLERRAGGGWERVEGTGPWWDTGAAEGFSYRLASERLQGAAFEPPTLGVSLLSPQAGRMLWEGDSVALTSLWDLPGAVEGLHLALVRERAGVRAWLDGACVAGDTATADTAAIADVEACWTDAPAATFAPDAVTPVVRLQSAVDTEPATITYVLEAVVVREGASWTVAAGELSYIDLARRIVWGDTHAHSGLSMDGCEDFAAGCADRTGWPAGDFFAQAAAVGLDFVAITDHAEWITLYTYATGEVPIDIWDASIATVAAAEGGAVLPILGAEWTYAAENVDEQGHRWGGHKTVLYGGLDVCPQYRIGFLWPRTTYERESGWAEGPNPVIAENTPGLWAALDAAAAACGEVDVITYFHHPALTRPQPVDWTWDQVAPDERYEMLVEIYSEHGMSECLDPEADGCAWHLAPEIDYYPRGSLQQALLMGYRLGIVAGTDSHDARPGSLADGASCASGSSEGSCQTYPGGLMGVMVAGTLDRPALFSALRARRTWATSVHREPIAAAVVGGDGAVYLPGDALPAGGGPWRLRVEVPDALDLTRVQAVSADGSVLLSSEGHAVAEEIAPTAPFYLRFRLDQDAERVWASPFFPEPEA